MLIERLVVSPQHAYEGRPWSGPVPVETSSPRSIELRAGYGVVGDRYAGRAAHRDAALTIIAAEALEAVADELGVPRFDPALARRTVVTRGLDVEALRGTDVLLDSGDGPVLLGGRRPAAPCAWMDVVLARGAHAALRGRAGVRFAVLGSGTLRVGPLAVTFPPGDSLLDGADEPALLAARLDPARAAVGTHRRRTSVPPRPHQADDHADGTPRPGALGMINCLLRRDRVRLTATLAVDHGNLHTRNVPISVIDCLASPPPRGTPRFPTAGVRPPRAP